MAKKAISNEQLEKAGKLLMQAGLYPDNLGEAKLFGFHDNETTYLNGILHKRLGNIGLAEEYFLKATDGIKEPAMAMFYNDQQPDMIYWQGLSYQQLGNQDKARILFNKLIEFGNSHIEDVVNIDYFAVSLPDLLIWEEDLNIRNRQLCLYLMGLGYKGLGENDRAYSIFKEVLSLNISHKGATIHLGSVDPLFL